MLSGDGGVQTVVNLAEGAPKQGERCGLEGTR